MEPIDVLQVAEQVILLAAQFGWCLVGKHGIYVGGDTLLERVDIVPLRVEQLFDEERDFTANENKSILQVLSWCDKRGSLRTRRNVCNSLHVNIIGKMVRFR